jgi:hypothetical protein
MNVPQIRALSYVSSVRGGSQAKIMRASDGHLYVVKFANNPQGPRTLANEYIASRLAGKVGLPVPEIALIEVTEGFVRGEPGLTIQLAECTVRCEPGLHFGSRYVVDPLHGRVFDLVPKQMLREVRNASAFMGMLAFDKWMANCDWRQALLWKQGHDRKYTVAFIDHGGCFDFADWRFSDAPLQGIYPAPEVYAGIHDWRTFEPWLGRLERLTETDILDCASEIPPEWYDADTERLLCLLEQLFRRRKRVRELILGTMKHFLGPLWEWAGTGRTAPPGMNGIRVWPSPRGKSSVWRLRAVTTSFGTYRT